MIATRSLIPWDAIACLLARYEASPAVRTGRAFQK